MTSPEKHWVEDLFPASFGFTLDEILTQPKPTEDLPTEESPDEPESVFSKVARRVSPLDVSTIQNVYERVWLMKYLEEEERRKRQEEEQSDPESEVIRSSVEGRSLLQSSKSKKKSKHAETSTSDINENAPLDIHDPCIWTSKEIDVLRAVFKTAKEQNTRLQAQLTGTQLQLDTVDEKYKKLNAEHTARGRKLKEAIKANGRLDILSKNLQKQVQEITRQTDGLKKHIEELKHERGTLLKQTHELRVKLDHERLDRKKAELQLQQQTQEAIREERIREENLKLMHDEDIQFLQKTIEDLTEQLTSEKKAHDRTKRGLTHLQKHFSALPIEGATVPDGVVRTDQIHFTY